MRSSLPPLQPEQPLDHKAEPSSCVVADCRGEVYAETYTRERPRDVGSRELRTGSRTTLGRPSEGRWLGPQHSKAWPRNQRGQEIIRFNEVEDREQIAFNTEPYRT